MKKILVVIGIVFILLGASIILYQKINEPFNREHLFKDELNEYIDDFGNIRQVSRTPNKHLYIPRGRRVTIIVIPAYVNLAAFKQDLGSFNLSVYTQADYEGDQNKPLLQVMNYNGSFAGFFDTPKYDQYVFVLEGGLIDVFEAYYESLILPIFIYLIGICLILIGGGITLNEWRRN